MLSRKRLLTLMLAAVMLWAVALTVFAHEVPDMTRKGSIQIAMHLGGEPVGGGSLTLYRVGAVREDNGNFTFALCDDFTDCTVSLENLQAQELAGALADYAADHQITGTRQEIGADGKISFQDLELGLYLLVQDQAAPGCSKAEPFLVSVPIMEEGAYVYDVDASPKVELEKEPVPSTSDPGTTPSTEPDPNLPQTGQLNWPIPVLAVLGLFLIAIGWALCLSRKKSK